MSETDESGGQLSGPGAGLSATGRTADQMGPGDGAGATYGDPGGTGTAADELAGESGQLAGEDPAAGVEDAEK